jgi:hypothetical protein
LGKFTKGRRVMRIMTMNQVTRICSVLAGTIVESASHAFCEINKLNEDHTNIGRRENV